MLLQRYILRQLVATFALTFGAMISVFSIGLIIQTMRSFGDSWLDFLAQTAPVIFLYASPFAILVASTTAATLVYGRLAADNELDAVRTSGIHANTIILPGLLFALGVAALCFAFYTEILPRALFARRNLIRESAITALRSPPPGKRTLRLGNAVVLSYLDAEAGVLKLPVLELLEDGRVTARYQGREARAILADEAQPAIELVDGHFTRYGEKNQVTDGTFRGEPLRVPLPIEGARSRPESPADMTASQLSEWLTPPNRGAIDNKAWTEYYTRFGRTAAVVPLVLVSIVLGMWIRKGNRLAGLGLALPPLLVYIVLMFIFQGLGEQSRIPSAVAGFSPAAVLTLAAGGFLARIYRR